MTMKEPYLHGAAGPAGAGAGRRIAAVPVFGGTGGVPRC